MVRNRYLVLVLSLGALVMGAAALLACPASLDEFCWDGACDGDAAATATGDTGPGVGATDPCLADPTAAACTSEVDSLFVSATGKDDGEGTKASPTKTIAAALTKITPTKRRIFVCPGTYPEDLVLDGRYFSVSIFGGLDCTFATKTTQKPVIGHSTTALTIRDATGIAFADIVLTASDAFDAGASSIAAFIANGGAAFLRTELNAGNGADGADAGAVSFDFSNLTLDGNPANGATPGAEKKITCPGGDITIGGAGGAAGFDGGSGTPGTTPNGGLGVACANSATAGGGAGLPAGSAPDGTGGDGLGKLTATGWMPSNSPQGPPGVAGQGGGGGGGYIGGGGGGGAGGCGGAGGGPSGGGGASIAFACFECAVRFDGSTFLAKRGGNGGNGTGGQTGMTAPGQARGGRGGNGTCAGGNGGVGGNGGASGGGGGGISAGVVYRVTPPAQSPFLDGDSTTHIVFGSPGQGGGGPRLHGADGGAAAQLPIP